MNRDNPVEIPNGALANLEEVTTSRHISDTTRFLLWGRAAGRCEFKGCNSPLWKNPVTQDPVNVSQAAHIYAFSAAGPRGNDGIAPGDLNTFSNLLLACHKCHKTIDAEKDGGRYTVELLQNWKAEHEARIERVTGIDPDHHSHVLLYGRGIGDVHSPLRYDRAAVAVFSRCYPAEDRAIKLGTKSSDWTERDAEFWVIEDEELRRRFERTLRERLDDGEISKLSVFALAPMPLLVRLGVLLGDIHDVEVYQFHREPKGWAWPEEEANIDLQIHRPTGTDGSPALVIALSATIEDERIQQVLGHNVSIWRLTIPEPTQECIRSRADLSKVYLSFLKVMDGIKAAHGHGETLSIFPAAPVAAMVELGRCRQPKADMEWTIYDEVRALGGFVEALHIGNSNHATEDSK